MERESKKFKRWLFHGLRYLLILVFVGFMYFQSNSQSGSGTLKINWDNVKWVSKTIPTLQLVENPMVRPGSPIHRQTFKALKDLRADFLRYVPWFPYPKMAVAELKPPTPSETFWDFTYLDSTMKSVMEATEGHPLVMNFSTTPAWMWKTESPVIYPDDPYQPFWNYNEGTELVDTSGQQIAAYYARVLSWYTKGGFTDELGGFHKSGHFYKIPYWEVLNEPDLEHRISPQLYTKIYDAVVRELKKISPEMKFIGLSLAMTSNPEYFEYFLNSGNHRFGVKPEGISYHHYSTPSWGDQDISGYQYTFFEKADAFLDKVRYIENIRKRLAPHTFTTINEIGVILRPPTQIKPIEKDYWNVASALYAYIFLELTKLGIDVAGESQLVGYPTQFPDVSMMNWETGNPNARYWVLSLLKNNFTPGDKLVQTSFEGIVPDGIIAQGFLTPKGRKILLINRRNVSAELQLPEEMNGGRIFAVDVTTGDNPPSAFPLTETKIKLQPYSVAVVHNK